MISPKKLTGKKNKLTAESRLPTTFVFSYAVTKNCIITLLWLQPWHLFSWRFGLPSAYFLLNHAPGGISLLIYMHSFSCIILLHLPVVFCIGILLRLCVSSGFSCTCCSSAKYLWFEPFFGFADILAIRVIFTRTSCWFSQYPYPSPYACEFITTMKIIGWIHPRLILLV